MVEKKTISDLKYGRVEIINPLELIELARYMVEADDNYLRSDIISLTVTAAGWTISDTDGLLIKIKNNGLIEIKNKNNDIKYIPHFMLFNKPEYDNIEIKLKGYKMISMKTVSELVGEAITWYDYEKEKDDKGFIKLNIYGVKDPSIDAEIISKPTLLFKIDYENESVIFKNNKGEELEVPFLLTVNEEHSFMGIKESAPRNILIYH